MRENDKKQLKIIKREKIQKQMIELIWQIVFLFDDLSAL